MSSSDSSELLPLDNQLSGVSLSNWERVNLTRLPAQSANHSDRSWTAAFLRRMSHHAVIRLIQSFGVGHHQSIDNTLLHIALNAANMDLHILPSALVTRLPLASGF
jgi:hypothetical protein